MKATILIVSHPTKRRDGVAHYTFTPIIDVIWYN